MARLPLLSIATRLLLWYSLITVVLRCPSSVSDLHSDHPQICRPYLQIRSSVDPYITPYIEPLYTSHVAPYVEKVRPYSDQAYARVYVPASNIARNIYERHLEQRINAGKTQTRQQWQKYIQPHVDTASREAQKQYDLYVAPYVARSSKTLQPWIKSSRKFTAHHYQHTILPSYKKALPYVQRSVRQAQHYTMHYIYPTVKSGAAKTVVFVQNQIWPTVRIMYGKHIEPQLEKIRVRIASYADGRKMEAVVNDVDDITSSAITNPEQALSSGSSLVASTLSDLSSSVSVTAGDISGVTTTAPTTQSGTISQTVEPILSDLAKQQMSSVVSTSTDSTDTASASSTGQPHPQDEIHKWDLKFTRAAEQGSKDLQSRVADILERQTEGQAKGVGQALLTRLEIEVDNGLSKVKKSILDAVAQLPEQNTADHNLDALNTILDTVRSSGKVLKDQAQQIREWRAQHETDTRSLVNTATESTLNVLDGIRDLGLQKIGMRWAEMEDVSYEDWQEYHNLKRRFDTLREDVLAVVSIDDLNLAISHADEVQNAAMGLAQTAAQELARLKDVAKWKIEARDTSDDFSTRYATVARAKELGQKVAGFFSGEDAPQVEGGEAGYLESILPDYTASTTKAPSTSTEAAESQEDVIMPMDTASSIASEITDAAGSTGHSVASSILSAASSVTEVVGDTVEDMSEAVTSTISTVTISAASAGEEGYHSATPLLDTISSTIAEMVSPSVETKAHETSAASSAEPKTVVGSPLHDATNIASPAMPESSDETIDEETVLVDDEVSQDVKEELSSTIPSSARESVASVASVASEYGQTATADIVDGALQASSSLQSQLSQAGQGYTDLSSSLASAATAVTAAA